MLSSISKKILIARMVLFMKSPSLVGLTTPRKLEDALPDDYQSREAMLVIMPRSWSLSDI